MSLGEVLPALLLSLFIVKNGSAIACFAYNNCVGGKFSLFIPRNEVSKISNKH